MFGSQKSIDLQAKYFLFGITLTTLAVSPFTSFDPFNAIKFVCISILASSLVVSFTHKITFKKFIKEYKYLSMFLTFFLLQSIFVLLTSPTPLELQLTGVDGRNTGFVLYLSLMIILIFICLKITPELLKNLIAVLMLTGLINALYGVCQYFNLDPINWSNPYNPVFGFFGNPNFQSAYMGIASASAWAVFFLKNNNTIKLILIPYLSLTLFIIIVSDSLQGLIIYVTGFLITGLIYIRNSTNYKKYTKYFGIGILIVGAVTILDILQLTPWNSFLYKESVSNRGDLWRAAWNMGIDNPVSGVGFDGYGYFYRQYRDQLAITERGAEISSNSAHNVFLDILTNGGFPLLIIYVLLLALVLKSAINGIRKSTKYNPFFTASVASWVAYQVQSLISINQIGIAVWGWVLGGAIIGFEKNMISENIDIQVKKRSNKLKSYPIAIVAITIGALASVPTYVSDADFRRAIDSKKIEAVLDTAYKWPQSPERMFQVAQIFRKNDLLDLSAQVAKDSVKKFPMDFRNWELLSTLSNLSELERENALRKMQELDPNKLNLEK
jgi:O-antigen ligase